MGETRNRGKNWDIPTGFCGGKNRDVITLLERIGDQWARGEVEGRAGIFPLDFVEVRTGMLLRC